MSYVWTADGTVPTADSSTYSADSGPGVNIPVLAASDLAARMLRLFPRGWLNDAAQAPGGVAYATFLGLATPLASFFAQLQFIKQGLRIKSAYGTALDTISVDYFGTALPRLPGESDVSFRTRILRTLLVPRVTRIAIQNALFSATGITPRMGEPWSPGDTGSYDVNTYYGVDGGENIAPCRWSDEMPYTGFIDITAPISTTTGGYPVYAIDQGAAYDVGTAAYDLAGTESTTSVSPSFAATVNSTVQAFKAMGITVGVRFSAVSPSTNTLSGFLATTSGGSIFAQSDSALTYTLQSWRQAFGGWGIWIETLPWLANTYLSSRALDFSFTASAPAPAAETVSWLGAVFTSTDPYCLRVPVNQGQTTLTCTLAIPARTVPIITPDWDTVVTITGFTSTSVSIALSVAGPGNLDIIFLPGAAEPVSGNLSGTPYLAVESGDVLVTESLVNLITEDETPAGITVNTPLPPSYAFFAMLSWVTPYYVVKGADSFTIYANPPPSNGGILYWAAVAN